MNRPGLPSRCQSACAFWIVRIAIALASRCDNLRFDLMPYGFEAFVPPSARQIALSNGSIWFSATAGITSDAHAHRIAIDLAIRAIATRTERPPRPLRFPERAACGRTP